MKEIQERVAEMKSERTEKQGALKDCEIRRATLSGDLDDLEDRLKTKEKEEEALKKAWRQRRVRKGIREVSALVQRLDKNVEELGGI